LIQQLKRTTKQMKTYTLNTLQNENFKAEDLTSEEYYLLVSLPYNRKAGYLDDVQEKLTGDNITEELNNILHKLPLIQVTETVFTEDDFLYHSIFEGDVQFYRVYVNDILLLIDTQGYTYGRYALILDAEQSDFKTVETDNLDYNEIIAQKDSTIIDYSKTIALKDNTIKELEHTIDILIKKNNQLKEFITTNF